MSEFKLCQAAGLRVHTDTCGKQFVIITDVEAMLAEAPLASCVDGGPWYITDAPFHTHTARLVCIQPLVRDTAESLLREFVRHTDMASSSIVDVQLLRDRARKLLGETK